jgi:prolipoprotein diacylglyceryltransferase
MGQWLSIPFILVGIGFMVWSWYCNNKSITPAAATAEPKIKLPKNKRHYKK